MKTAVGFVGNSIGLSEGQEKNLRSLLHEMDIGAICHTNASGAERDAHYMFLCSTEAEIHVYEPLEYYGRAVTAPTEPRVFAHMCHSLLDAAAVVVSQSDVVIFAPANMTQHEMKKLLGGTPKGQMAVYASIVCRTETILRSAANANKRLIILREDGGVIRYN